MTEKKVLVTGANGYIGFAVANAFVRAGYTVYGLVRRGSSAAQLAKAEILPIIGTPSDLSFLSQIPGTIFDVVVSNTEDNSSVEAHNKHLDGVSRMFDALGQEAQNAGKRLLVIFTSGCKDYGSMGAAKHGDLDLAAHTEDSPLNPPEILRGRTKLGQKVIGGGTNYDGITTRPTIVYGYASSHYANLFLLARNAEKVLRIVGHPHAIMHSLHVDDCAEATVLLAEHPRRHEVVGQAFNMSNARYETVEEVFGALARAYGLELELILPSNSWPETPIEHLTNFSQWVGSEKLRKVTGWTEKRPSFVEGIRLHKVSAEAHLNEKSEEKLSSL